MHIINLMQQSTYFIYQHASQGINVASSSTYMKIMLYFPYKNSLEHKNHVKLLEKHLDYLNTNHFLSPLAFHELLALSFPYFFFLSFFPVPILLPLHVLLLLITSQTTSKTPNQTLYLLTYIRASFTYPYLDFLGCLGSWWERRNERKRRGGRRHKRRKKERRRKMKKMTYAFPLSSFIYFPSKLIK